MTTAASAGVVPEDARSAHLERVAGRLAEEGRLGRLEERAGLLRARIDGAARTRLLQQAVNARSQAQRVLWLRREADLLGVAAYPLSACSAGCSHCCHIGVLVAEPEAKVIGRAIGRLPAEPPADRTLLAGDVVNEQARDAARAQFEMRHFGSPCSFLLDGRCSVYAHRPLACRRLFNVDRDALLCQLVPDETISVPYVDTTGSQVADLLAMGTNSRLADIRDWFPRVEAL